MAKMDKSDIEYIANELRRSSTQWQGRKECLRLARRRVLIGKTKKGGPKYKYHWQCRTCRDWFRDEGSMEVDHIIEIGPEPKTLEELCLWIPKVFCGQENLACLCVACHLKKTTKFNSARTLWKRKPLKLA